MPQVKGFALLPRRPDISMERFHQHWSTIHLDHAVRITSLRRYVQLHGSAAPMPGFAPSIYDGVPETWFDDLDAAAGLARDPNYTQYARIDEPNFIDMSRMASVTTLEDVRLDGPPISKDTALVKGLLLVGRRADVELVEFTAWWRDRFGPLVLDTVPRLVRYVQCLPVPEVYTRETPPCDGVAEMWWTDQRAFNEAKAGLEELAGRLRQSPVDLARTFSLVGEELRVIWPEASTSPSRPASQPQEQD